MAFSSDPAGVSNQVVSTINLPLVDQKDLFDERLESKLKEIANIVNTKAGGVYSLSEVLAFKTIFTVDDPQTFRNVYRKSFDLIDLNGGNIAGGATVNFAHAITNIGDSIIIYVSCVTTDPEYFTAVYPDVFLDATNINFTNPHASAVSSAIAICEYTKS